MKSPTYHSHTRPKRTILFLRLENLLLFCPKHKHGNLPDAIDPIHKAIETYYIQRPFTLLSALYSLVSSTVMNISREGLYFWIISRMGKAFHFQKRSNLSLMIQSNTRKKKKKRRKRMQICRDAAKEEQIWRSPPLRLALFALFSGRRKNTSAGSRLFWKEEARRGNWSRTG